MHTSDDVWRDLILRKTTKGVADATMIIETTVHEDDDDNDDDGLINENVYIVCTK